MKKIKVRIDGARTKEVKLSERKEMEIRTFNINELKKIAFNKTIKIESDFLSLQYNYNTQSCLSYLLEATKQINSLKDLICLATEIALEVKPDNYNYDKELKEAWYVSDGAKEDAKQYIRDILADLGIETNYAWLK